MQDNKLKSFCWSLCGKITTLTGLRFVTFTHFTVEKLPASAVIVVLGVHVEFNSRSRAAQLLFT